MNPADIIAIKVAVTNIAQAQRQLASIQKRVDDMQRRNDNSMRRGTRSFMQWVQGNRAHRQGVEGLVGSYGRLAAVFGVVSGAAYGMYKSIQTFEQLKSFRQGLGAMVGGEAATSIEKQMRSLARITGARATEFMPNIQSLVGTESTSETEVVPLLRAFLALGKKNGAMPDQLNRAFTQFTQVASSGKLQGDELRIMQENMVNLRGLLKRAGMGDRIGSQTDQITFDEIKKVLLRFGESAEAARFLSINSDGATAAMNRLFDTIMLDVLPVFGKMLTPAATELATWLESLAKKATPEVIERYGKRFIEFIGYITRFIQKEGPVMLATMGWIAEKGGQLLKAFTDLDTFLGGTLMKTLVALAAINVGGKAIGAVAGGAAGSAAGGVLSGIIGFLLGAFRGGLAKAIYAAVGWALKIGLAGLAETLALLGTAVAGTSIAIIAAVTAVGAAIGLVIGWLINQIPAVQTWQRNAGEWWNDTFGGGAASKAASAKAHPDWQPGGRLHEKWKAEREGNSTQPSAQSARRSDPARLITEGVGMRYAR